MCKRFNYALVDGFHKLQNSVSTQTPVLQRFLLMTRRSYRTLWSPSTVTSWPWPASSSHRRHHSVPPSFQETLRQSSGPSSSSSGRLIRCRRTQRGRSSASKCSLRTVWRPTTSSYIRSVPSPMLRWFSAVGERSDSLRSDTAIPIQMPPSSSLSNFKVERFINVVNLGLDLMA